MKIDHSLNTQAVEHKEADPRDKLKEVSQAYETLFVNQLVSEMRKSVGKAGLVPESQAEKVYQGMLDSNYSEQISKSEQLGLAKIIYAQLLRSTGLR